MSLTTYTVWRTPNGGTVVTRHDSGDRVTGWAIPGSSDFLTRDIRKVAKHITDGHYTKADQVHALAVLIELGIVA